MNSEIHPEITWLTPAAELHSLSAHLNNGGDPAPCWWVDVLEDPRRGLLIVDRHLCVVHVTRTASKLLGITELLSPGIPLSELLTRGECGDSIATAITDGLRRAFEGHACASLLAGGGPQQQQLQITARSVPPDHAVAVFEPYLTDTAGGKPHLRFETADPLTELASRVSFENRLRTTLGKSGAAPVAVLFLDLDRFKVVNDTLGHAVGDSLLRLAAERLVSAVRDGDLVARLGGDEFAVLLDLPASDATAADMPTEVAKRILEVVQRTYLIEGNLVNIGVSIGIALAPSHGSTAEGLLRNADLALYEAKNSGRGNFHFFHSKLEDRARERRASELELRRALALSQFEVHYQPQVDIVHNRVVGFEALVRWRHPEKGLIPPSGFLPLAEEIGVIGPLGEWVLRTACRQAMHWAGDITIAVNASPLQFITGRFAETVQQVLEKTGLPGARLEIEITEGLLLRTEAVVFETLDALRAMDVRIAMDDFGTGYASLSQLAHFPFDKIKIDRSLSGFEGQFPKQRAIVRAIAALGESLGVSTMAEGVETADQLQRLHKDGCTSVQGYLFSKPVPASETGELIARLNAPPISSAQTNTQGHEAK